MRNCQRILFVLAAFLPNPSLALKEQSPRVIHGDEANIVDHPEVVALQFLGRARTVCSGLIIQTRWFLSAAHCFHPQVIFRFYFQALYPNICFSSRQQAGLGPWNAQVRAGSSMASSGGEVYRMELAICHKLYRPFYSFHDIGIAKTTVPFRLSQTIGLAVVADHRSIIPLPGTICTVVGFGNTRIPPWDIPEVVRLRFKNIPILDSTVCERRYRFDRSTQLCAGSPTNYMGSDHVGFEFLTPYN
jgi:Trypsin